MCVWGGGLFCCVHMTLCVCVREREREREREVILVQKVCYYTVCAISSICFHECHPSLSCSYPVVVALQTLCAIEAQLENMCGTFNCKLKGEPTCLLSCIV